MNARKPPKLAIWMLKHFGCSPDTEVVIGDLVERYSQEQNRLWFLGQVFTTLVGGFLEEALRNKRLVIRAMLAGWLGFFLFRAVVEFTSFNRITPSTHWAFDYPTLFRLCIVLCSGLGGRIASRVGGVHHRAVLFSYAASFLAFMVIEGGDFMNPWVAINMSLNLGAVLIAGLVMQPHRPSVA